MVVVSVLTQLESPRKAVVEQSWVMDVLHEGECEPQGIMGDTRKRMLEVLSQDSGLHQRILMRVQGRVCSGLDASGNQG